LTVDLSASELHWCHGKYFCQLYELFTIFHFRVEACNDGRKDCNAQLSSSVGRKPNNISRIHISYLYPPNQQITGRAAWYIHAFSTRMTVRWRFCLQETGVYELNCLVRVDEFGFFVYWKSDGKVSLSGSKYDTLQALFYVKLAYSQSQTVHIPRIHPKNSTHEQCT